MISWWASHLGRHPVQQWGVSRMVAWYMLEVCWAFLLVWDVGRGCSVLGACWGTEELGWNEGSRKKLQDVILQSNGFKNY
jgi:hypothetical protein